MAKRKIAVCWLMVILAVCPGGAVSAEGDAARVDNTLYAELLADHVRDGLVDYDGLKRDEDKLDRYLDILAETDVGSLGREGRFAFYINLYNAWTLKLILMHWPGIDSIKDTGSLFTSPWEKELVRTGGEVVSLDDVEHGILRPEFKDYRVHAAINCSALSCPPLPAEPFEAADLDDQLDRVFRAFVNNIRLNRVEDGELRLSKVFSWFEEDFTPDVLTVVREYAGPELAPTLEELGDDPEVDHLDYDWSLNNTRP